MHTPRHQSLFPLSILRSNFVFLNFTQMEQTTLDFLWEKLFSNMLFSGTSFSIPVYHSDGISCFCRLSFLNPIGSLNPIRRIILGDVLFMFFSPVSPACFIVHFNRSCERPQALPNLSNLLHAYLGKRPTELLVSYFWENRQRIRSPNSCLTNAIQTYSKALLCLHSKCDSRKLHQ